MALLSVSEELGRCWSGTADSWGHVGLTLGASMELRILSVGKPAEPCVAELVQEYLRRIPNQWRVNWTTVRPHASEVSTERLGKEGERLLRHIRPGDFVVVLDERGKETDSLTFARWLGDHLGQGKRIVFVVGGPEGVSNAVKDRANEVIRLSRLTLQHDLALLVLVEQLYRASTILRGHPYHR